MSRILRTPAARFEGLPDFPWEPSWITVRSDKDDDFKPVRMAWVEAGDRSDPTVLLLHGEPSWSFLYRKMIPVFRHAGFHPVAPDLIGFGRSDKPSETSDYTYARHTAWLRSFIEQLDLKNIRLVCQDWGGLLGLRLLGEMPERFEAVVASNTFLPAGEAPLGEAFDKWRQFSQSVPEFPISGALQMGTVSELSDEVLAAYDAPFPDESYKAGARIFPALVPQEHDDPACVRNREAWKTLEKLDVPFLTAFGDSDPITRGADKALQRRILGAEGEPHCTIDNAGHFIQEDQGEEFATVAASFFLEHGRRRGRNDG